MVIVEDPPLTLPTPTGPMRCQLLRPAAPGRYPGVVLFSEIFQITGPIRRAAAVLAGQGQVVVVPEVFHDLLEPGAVLAYDQAGADRGNACKVGRPVEAYDADARAALDALQAHPACTGALGVMGICIGGHLAFRAAMDPRVRAAACFYATDIHKGSLGRGGDDTLARVARGDLAHAEVLMIWGRQDPHIPLEGRRVIYDALASAPGGGVSFEWHEFNAAHAFMRDEGPRYNPELAAIAWGLVHAMLARKLHAGDSGPPLVTGG